MIIVAEPRLAETPNAAMTSYATPSLGSTEVCAWRVSMQADTQGPVHAIDREQVWLPLTGTLTFTVDDTTTTVGPGQSAILPAGELRQIRAADGPVEALVCMPIGGQASVPDRADAVPLPWAQ